MPTWERHCQVNENSAAASTIWGKTTVNLFSRSAWPGYRVFRHPQVVEDETGTEAERAYQRHCQVQEPLIKSVVVALDIIRGSLNHIEAKFIAGRTVPGQVLVKRLGIMRSEIFCAFGGHSALPSAA